VPGRVRGSGIAECKVLVTVGYSLHLALLFIHVVRTTLERYASPLSMTWAIWLPPEQGLDFPLLRGMDLLADVLNYTDLTPQIQVSEMVDS